MAFLSNNGGESYNLCHCRYLYCSFFCTNRLLDWSNFEIADMDFWRGEAYQRFFDFLDSRGGFYYEVNKLPTFSFFILSLQEQSQRWGDAPVHTIAASLFARKDQIHFFRDMGYRHEPFQHCPTDDEWVKGRCSCNPNESFGES